MTAYCLLPPLCVTTDVNHTFIHLAVSAAPPEELEPPPADFPPADSPPVDNPPSDLPPDDFPAADFPPADFPDSTARHGFCGAAFPHGTPAATLCVYDVAAGFPPRYDAGWSNFYSRFPRQP